MAARKHKVGLSWLPKGLELSDPEFESLWGVLDKSRPSSKTVNVDKVSFSHVMADYSRLLAHLDEVERNLRAGNVAEIKPMEQRAPVEDDEDLI